MSGWRSARLDSLCELFTDGDWIESKNQSQSGIRLVQTGNVGDGVFKDRAEKARYISEATFKRLRCTELSEGDCLISRLPDPVGRSCLLPSLSERAITAVDCTIARFDRSKIEPVFFNYYSRSRDYFDGVARLTSGATRQRISRKNLGQLEVPLPPIEEQRRIVAVLDEAFAAIATATANAEKNLANARELFEAVLDHSMDGASRGWERRSLGSLGKTVTGNTPKTGDAGNFGDFVPFIKPGDFNPDGTLDYENEGLSEVGASSSRHIANGAALMVCIGATIGKSGYAERDITANQQINALLPANGVSGKFVYYQFLTAGFQKAVLRQSGQATLPIISKSKWNDLPVWLPSLAEQLRIVDELDRLLVERLQLEELAIRKVETLSDLKQSLLHRAFSGELTEREPLAA